MMIKRIIEFTIERSKSKDMQLDVSSTKRLYSSLSNNILQLREGGGGVNKDQATEFFNQAFEVNTSTVVLSEELIIRVIGLSDHLSD